jgi:integrase
VELETIESFLKSLRARGGIEMAAPKTHENNRKSLHRFFGWCVERPQLFITLNPAEHATRKDDKAQNEIHSLNAERSEQLMRYLEERYPQLIPRFAIALFGGIRPNGEMDRLAEKSNAIRLENGIINITGDVAKVRGETRHVKIQPNLAEWLRKYGTTLFPENSKRDIAAVRKVFGLNQKKFHDCLRHSFISAHAQCFGSFVETALESGNSEKIIRERYYNTLTTREDAERFWNIYPKADIGVFTDGEKEFVHEMLKN